ncbi:MAG TPA: sarcosine oxidase subunit gamma family protein [Alphaproteobacteria bacterium]|nr:sarcosine oxidase subunit gamma family protein [Alphaproteobacteria bacterium]
MVELPPRRSPLAAVYRPGNFGSVAASGPGIVLCERRGRCIVQLAARDERYESAAARIEDRLGLPLPRTPNRASVAGALAALWTGPGRALVVGPDSRDLEAELAAALDGEGSVALTDLSHARAIIRIAGPRLRDLLAKGCGLDFHPRAFAAGACVQSAYHHVNVLIHAVDDSPAAELYAPRGFACALWEHLVDGAHELGCRVEADSAA